jgi:hypothetical protein
MMIQEFGKLLVSRDAVVRATKAVNDLSTAFGDFLFPFLNIFQKAIGGLQAQRNIQTTCDGPGCIAGATRGTVSNGFA